MPVALTPWHWEQLASKSCFPARGFGCLGGGLAGSGVTAWETEGDGCRHAGGKEGDKATRGSFGWWTGDWRGLKAWELSGATAWVLPFPRRNPRAAAIAMPAARKETRYQRIPFARIPPLGRTTARDLQSDFISLAGRGAGSGRAGLPCFRLRL